VELAPENWFYVNTLGVALYRTARFEDAIGVFERGLIVGKGDWDSFDLFFLAMAHKRLGHEVEARHLYDRAIRWIERRKDLPPARIVELAAYRAEADAVLALVQPDLPANVFAPR
jgi:tetratricopeptide (TPR) repeat protein